MLSFKQYLLESILSGSEFRKETDGFRHSHEIDGNSVKIWYTKIANRKHHYHVDFMVNGDIWGKQAHGGAGHKVASFIKASVNNFIVKHKPDRLYAKGIEDKKDKFYSSYWNHLSKKRGYATSYDDEYGHGLHT